jgi:predicted phage terminase large subunit-like protein
MTNKAVLTSKDVMSTEFMSPKEKFNLITPQRRLEIIKQMPDEEVARLEYDWEWQARPKQLAPDYPQSKATSFCMCKFLEAQASTDKKLKLENFPPCDEISKSGRSEVIFDHDGNMSVVPIPDGKSCQYRSNWSVWVLLAGRGFGKSLDVNTPIPTVSGWKRMGDIEAGDQLFDEQGNKTTVLIAHEPYHTEDVYELIFSDKSSLIADKDHLWTFWEHLDNKQYGRYDQSIDPGKFPDDWATYVGDKYNCYGTVIGHFGAKTYSTEELMARLDKSPRIPLARPLVIDETVELLIHPWILGYWLGNGDSRSGGVHTGSHDGDRDFDFILDRFLAFGYPVDKAKPDHVRDEDRIYCGHIYSRKLHEELKSLNLLNNKSVPNQYLRASTDQRTLLLQGMMDSDGHAGNHNALNYVGFSSTIKELADAVFELACSIGEKPQFKEGVGKLYGVEKKRSYGVEYRPNTNPFLLPRKRDRISDPKTGSQGLRHKHRIVKEIRKVPARTVRCITVDSPSALYLAGRSMIPTHNTRVGAELVKHVVMEGQCKRISIISPTAADARDVAVEGESGILAISPPWLKPVYESTKRRITWPNGAIASLFSAEEPERLRGPQFDFNWSDELAAWDQSTQQMVWDMMNFGLRLGKNPRSVVTTTPKPTVLIQNLVKLSKDPVNRVIITTGSTYENRTNLAAPFMRQITQYEGTNLGRQEIYAELIDIEESGIIKRTWFKKWPANNAMPLFEFVIQSYDTAFTDKTTNDPTACTVYGVFRPTPDDPYCVMIIDAWRDHLKYPELRTRAKDDHQATYGDQNAPVDLIIIEDKGSGIPLIQDLQRAGLPIRRYNPGRPDKTMRLHAVSHLVYNGRVYIPESKQVPGEYVTWAEDFIREVCAFPNSQNDDYVDTFSQALAVFRDQEWLSVDVVKNRNEDEEDEDEDFVYENPYAI